MRPAVMHGAWIEKYLSCEAVSLMETGPVFLNDCDDVIIWAGLTVGRRAVTTTRWWSLVSSCRTSSSVLHRPQCILQVNRNICSDTESCFTSRVCGHRLTTEWKHECISVRDVMTDVSRIQVALLRSGVAKSNAVASEDSRSSHSPSTPKPTLHR